MLKPFTGLDSLENLNGEQLILTHRKSFRINLDIENHLGLLYYLQFDHKDTHNIYFFN